MRVLGVLGTPYVTSYVRAMSYVWCPRIWSDRRAGRFLQEESLPSGVVDEHALPADLHQAEPRRRTPLATLRGQAARIEAPLPLDHERALPGEHVVSQPHRNAAQRCAHRARDLGAAP